MSEKFGDRRKFGDRKFGDRNSGTDGTFSNRSRVMVDYDSYTAESLRDQLPRLDRINIFSMSRNSIAAATNPFPGVNRAGKFGDRNSGTDGTFSNRSRVMVDYDSQPPSADDQFSAA